MESLVDLVTAELAQPVDPRAAKMAEMIAAKHGAASRAVLFYGSCLRETRLDGLMLDFYLIVSEYPAAYPKSWLATANRLIPPNVFPFEADGLAAKYAVLSEADFARLCGQGADNVSVWARFAQPSRLVWSSDKPAADRAIAAIATAAPTLLALAAPTMVSPTGDPLDLWRQGFTLTYGAELRAERGGRPGMIVDADPDRYRRFSAPALAAAEVDPAVVVPEAERMRALCAWRKLQRRGKRLTLLRLAKASATFAGGIDYLAWKINRHAGTAIAIRGWQRRWPLIGALSLLPRLIVKGAVR